MARSNRTRAWALTATAIVLASIAVSQAPRPLEAAVTTVQSISAKDKAEGAKAHPQLLTEFGGAMTGPQAGYVERVGKNIAVQSGLSNARGDFTVTLLNSPVNNAFAIPGGYVYTTRQLVALMNNEAELAAVLGHEVGHVAARHADKRQKAATKNQLLGVLGSVLSGVLLGNNQLGQIGQQVFSQGSQLLTLRYSRTQETQADNLGVSYLQRAGYDPRAMGSVLQALANQNALDARLMGTQNRVPEWASTHPDPASRVRAAMTRAGASPTGRTDRDAFLAGIDGLTYGDDPQQGIVEGRNFVHPVLRLSFQAPEGFYLVNGTRAVTIGGQAGKGEFGSGPYSGDLDGYVRGVFGALTQQGQASIAPQSIQRTTISGMPVAYGMARVQGQNGQLDVAVVAYEFARDQAFHFLTITQAGNSNVFNGMYSSLRRLPASEASSIRSRRLQVVTVKAGNTIQSLAARMAYSSAQLDRFLVLNNLTAQSQVAPGQRVKIVVYGPPVG